MPLINYGELIGEAIPGIDFTGAITRGDLPPLPRNFWEKWSKLHTNVESLLQEQMGDRYVPDPLVTRMSELLPEQKEQALEDFWDLMGGRQLVSELGGEAQRGPQMFKPVVNALTKQLERSPAGRFPVAAEEFIGQNIDPRLLFWATSTVRFNPGLRGIAEEVEDQYSIAGKVMSPNVFAHLHNTLEKGFGKGKTLVFDVESAGLDPRTGIWQLSAQMVGPRGETIASKTFHFRNPTMQTWGEIGSNRENLEQFLTRGQKLQGYPEGLGEFFQMAKEADYISGHSVFFDYGMVSHLLKNDPAVIQKYKSDKVFRENADAFMTKFVDKEGRVGNVLDTRYLSRFFLGQKIKLAPELKGIESPQEFSLQNILLQSDLMQRVINAEGEEKVRAWMERGMHFSDVDVPVTSHLLRALIEQREGGPGLDLTASIPAQYREAVLKSRAIGPNIEMTNLDQLNEKLLEPLLRTNALQFREGALEGANIASVDELLKGGVTAERLQQLGLANQIARIQLTPLQQRIAMSRRIALNPKDKPLFEQGATVKERLQDLFPGEGWRKAIPREGAFGRLGSLVWGKSDFSQRSATELAFQAGTWNRAARPYILPSGMLRGAVPSPQEWAKVQDTFAKQGLPFAGLDFMERHIMALLGSAAPDTPIVNHIAQNVQRVFGADVAPVARWVATPEFGITKASRSNIARVPEHVLAEAEQAGVFNLLEDPNLTRTHFNDTILPQMYHTSPFTYTDKFTKAPSWEAGLMFKFGEGEQGEAEREAFMKFLRAKAGTPGYESLQEVDDLGRTLLDRMALSIQNNSDIYGMQVATLTGFKDKTAAKQIHDAVAQISGGVVDNSHLQFQVARMPTQEKGVITTTGAWARPELMSREEAKGAAAHVAQSAQIYEEALKLGKNSRMMKAFEALKTSDITSEAQMKMINAYLGVSNKAPLLALAGAALAGGYYRHRKKQKESIYDQTFEFQKPESEDWYRNYKRELDQGYIPITQSPRGGQSSIPNPLDTADLVHQLHARDRASMYMGTSKYKQLYSFNSPY